MEVSQVMGKEGFVNCIMMLKIICWNVQGMNDRKKEG